MDPVWQVIIGFAAAVLLTLSVLILLCCCCSVKKQKSNKVNAAEDKDVESQNGDSNDKLSSSSVWKSDIPPAPPPPILIPPSVEQSKTSLRSSDSVKSISFIVRPKSSPKSDIFKAKNRILSKCPRNYKIIEENYRQPSYKGRDRHLYSGPGELTCDIAINISERRSWSSVHENTVMQEPPQWNLCQWNNYNYGDNKRIISSSKVLTIHCKRYYGGSWTAHVKGHCFAIFTESDSGHLFYKKTYATVNE